MQSTSQHYRKKGMHRDEQSFFNVVKTSNIYESEQRDANSGGQFQLVQKSRPRNRWELRDHTFNFDWPKPQAELSQAGDRRSSRLSSSGPRY